MFCGIDSILVILFFMKKRYLSVIFTKSFFSSPYLFFFFLSCCNPIHSFLILHIGIRYLLWYVQDILKTKCIEVKLLWVFFVFPPSFFALFGCKFIASNLYVLLYICPSQCFLISFHQVIPEEEKEMKGFTVLHIHIYASHICIYVYMYMSMCITCRSIYQ